VGGEKILQLKLGHLKGIFSIIVGLVSKTVSWYYVPPVLHEYSYNFGDIFLRNKFVRGLLLNGHMVG